MSYSSAPGEGNMALSSFSNLLKGRSLDWTGRARALKFDLEYKPVEQERKRVAGELHDQVLPLLSRLSRYLQQEPDSKVLGEKVTALIETVRHLLGELHPVDLEELGLSPAISNLCARYSKLHSISIIHRETGGDCHMPPVQQVAVYRAIQLVLRMFAQKGAGTLILTSDIAPERFEVSLSIRDSDHSAVKGLIGDMSEHDLDEFAAWSHIGQMKVGLETIRVPHRVIFFSGDVFPAPTDQTDSPPLDEHSQIRLLELEQVVSAAQEEWAEIISRDTTFSGNMSLAIERQRLCRLVEETIFPMLEKISNSSTGVCKSSTGNRRVDVTDQSQSKAELPARIEEIRGALADVVTARYPEELISLHLLELINLSVEKLKRATMANTKIVAGRVDQLRGLPLETKIASYRMIHEVLHNVEKHSQASSVLILVEPAKDHVIICVEDNGLGMSECSGGDARGLRGVKERAHEIGASVSWQNSISYGSGTLVTILLPTC